MKIERVHIRNFRAIDSIELPIDPSMLILHGVNGQGKTSVLSAIAFGLQRIPQLLKAPGKVKFNTGDVRIDQDETHVRISTRDGLHWVSRGLALSVPFRPRSGLAGFGDDAGLRARLEEILSIKEVAERDCQPLS